MLKRISKIKNIGRFKAASCGDSGFEKITIVHGRNTYGKSTLGDIFSSLKSGNTEAISKRRTIPIDGSAQEVTFAFLGAGPGETAVKLTNAGWDRPIPDGLSMQVFDDGFYHSNVFSSRKFNRETKENLSSFILGQQGVAKASVIAQMNKDKGEATRRRNVLQRDAFQSVDDIQQFLTMVVDEKIEIINEKLNTLREQLADVSRQQNNAQAIIARPSMQNVECNDEFRKSVVDINKILTSSVESYHEAAREKVRDHIAKNLSGSGLENWISHGLAIRSSDSCSFCGQAIGEEAAKLLDAYRLFFDQEYIANENLVSVNLKKLSNEFRIDNSSQLRAVLEKNILILGQYPELNENGFFIHLGELYSTGLDNLFVLLESYATELTQAYILIQEAVSAKKLSPHNPVVAISCDNVTLIAEQIIKIVNEKNTIQDAINNEISLFKRSLDKEHLLHRFAEINQQIKFEEMKVKRIELDPQCQEFNHVLQRIADLDQKIPLLQSELNTQQSQYLQSYFANLNRYFVNFGSSNFLLEIGNDTSGHVPVYFLKVRFQGVEISERDLDCVFSESDRRALALSIFAASIDAMPPADKSNCIVVMDDPVTSFDNQRMTATHRYIVNLAESIRQVIILSHFQDDVVRFFQAYRYKPVKLLEISTEEGFSTLSSPNLDEFLLDDHQSKREVIFKFIDGQSNSYNCGDLRIFLEVELSFRFAKQIRDYRIASNSLCECIESLATHGVITADISGKLHAWREDLNPDHHRWTGRDIEDQRSTARSFMKFLYEDLRPVDVAV